jgi:hypothetical protein
VPFSLGFFLRAGQVLRLAGANRFPIAFNGPLLWLVAHRRPNVGHQVRLHWEHHREGIRSELLAGTYQLSPVPVFGSRDGHRNTHRFSRWSAQDAVMRKPLDQMIPSGCADARFMDDGAVLTRTCRTVWKVEVRQVAQKMLRLLGLSVWRTGLNRPGATNH